MQICLRSLLFSPRAVSFLTEPETYLVHKQRKQGLSVKSFGGNISPPGTLELMQWRQEFSWEPLTAPPGQGTQTANVQVPKTQLKNWTQGSRRSIVLMFLI